MYGNSSGHTLETAGLIVCVDQRKNTLHVNQQGIYSGVNIPMDKPAERPGAHVGIV